MTQRTADSSFAAARRAVASAPIVFCTITDERFVPGTIALINSLHLAGHHDLMVILDCGMRADQRALLEPVAIIIPWDRAQATNPTLFKPFAVLTEPSGIVVIIDSDIVVTSRLDGPLRLAAGGAVCAFPDPEADRWFASWEHVFGLVSAPRRQPYVNAGFVVFSAQHWPKLLERWWELCRSIWHEPTLYEHADDGPTSQADQDALNALLMSEVDADKIEFLDPDLAPVADALSEGVRVDDVTALACDYGGKRPLLLHSAGHVKPWIAEDRGYLRPTAYTKLLRRLLARPDVRVRPLSSDLPRWLRRGWAGRVAATALIPFAVATWLLRRLPWLRTPARRVLRAVRGDAGSWRRTPSTYTPTDDAIGSR
jgi:hypothetical protein